MPPTHTYKRAGTASGSAVSALFRGVMPASSYREWQFVCFLECNFYCEEVCMCFFLFSPQEDWPALQPCILAVPACICVWMSVMAQRGLDWWIPCWHLRSPDIRPTAPFPDGFGVPLFPGAPLPFWAVTMASLVLNETGMEDCGIDDSFKYNLYSAVYSVVFVLGLITNCAALFVFCFRMKMRNETTMFMTNLALSDLVFVFTLPFKVFYNVNRHWPFGDGLCKVSGTAFITNIYGSMLFLTCISVDRFLAIVYPFRSRSIRTRRNAALVCAAVWLTIVGGGISVTFFSTINSTNRATTCFEGFSKSTWRTYLSKITIFIEVSYQQLTLKPTQFYLNYIYTLYLIKFLFIIIPDCGFPHPPAGQLGMFLAGSADITSPGDCWSWLRQQETCLTDDSGPFGHLYYLLCPL